MLVFRIFPFKSYSYNGLSVTRGYPSLYQLPLLLSICTPSSIRPFTYLSIHQSNHLCPINHAKSLILHFLMSPTLSTHSIHPLVCQTSFLTPHLFLFIYFFLQSSLFLFFFLIFRSSIYPFIMLYIH